MIISMPLYQCKKCDNQFVTDGEEIFCPNCDGNDYLIQGSITHEDVNELLAERRELLEDANKKIK